MMKRRTSRFLKSVAISYMAFPFAYIVAAAVLFDIPGNSCVQLLLSPFYYIVSAIAVFAGYGLWEMFRWGWYVYIASSFLISYQTALVMSQYSETHHKVLGFAISLLTIFVAVYRVSKEIRVPYFYPKIRWWESNPRYRLAVPVDLTHRVSEQNSVAEILDLSMKGCFVKTRVDLKSDEPVLLRFSVFKLPVVVEGFVVWKSESTVTHPRGVGVMFGDLDRVQKRNLKLISKKLREIAQFYQTSRYLLSQEEFAKRFEEIESESLERFSKKTVAVKEPAS